MPKKFFIFLTLCSFFMASFFLPKQKILAISFEAYGDSSTPVISNPYVKYTKSIESITVSADVVDISGIRQALAILLDSSGAQLNIWALSKNDSSNKYSITVNNLKLAAGTYTVNFYAEDVLGNGTPSDAVSVSFSVQASATNISLLVSPEPVEYGTSFTISAVLKSDTGVALANKTIDFYIDSTYNKIGSQKTGLSGEPATITKNTTGSYYPGSYTVIAKYAGDSEYLSATGQKSFAVAAHSGITFYMSSYSAKPGDTITLTANLYCTDTGNEGMSGPIKFYFDDKLISTGPAIFNYTLPSNTSLTTHTLYAKYDGGTAYIGSLGYVTVLPFESAKKTLTVANPALVVSASAVASPVYLNPTSTVTFSSTVSGGTGSYAYTWSGDCTGTSLTCTVTASTAKTYTATLKVVSGETKTTSASVTVYPKLIVSAVASPAQVSPGQAVSFSAVVAGGTGSYSYSWAGACTGTGQVCQTSFSSIGNYTATVTVTSGVQTVPASALVAVVWNCGDNLIDTRDGKSYKTVLIGSQCWMAENLNVGTFTTSTQGTSCSSIQKYCYSNAESYCNVSMGSYGSYGALYQWDQAMCGSTTAGVQGICPAGWHIPTHSEVTTLERAVCTMSGSTTCNTTFPDNTSKTGWLGSSTQAVGTNLKGLGSTGFNGLLVGYKTSSAFNYMFTYGYFWSSTQSGSSAWYRRVGDSYSSVYRNVVSKGYSLPVRCLKN